MINDRLYLPQARTADRRKRSGLCLASQTSASSDPHRRLYGVETDIRGRSAKARRAIRQERSRPVIDAMEPWLRTRLNTFS